MAQNAFQPFSSRADDIWHAGEHPGGYEWWYFDALSDDGRDCLVVIFLVGFIFSPNYNRSVARYLHDNKEPVPRPVDYPAVAVTYYRDGRPVYRAINEFSARDFSAGRTWPECHIGNSYFKLDESGGRYALELDAVLWRGRRLRGSFAWDILAVSPSDGFSEKTPHGAHNWNLVAPRCRVTGRLSVAGRNGQTQHKQEFSGTGYHDHNHDGRWLPATVAEWDWGRAHFSDATTAVYYRYREHGATEAAGYLLLATPDNLQTYPAQIVAHGTRQHYFGLRYARELTITAENLRLEITSRRVLDGSFFYLRCQDTATLIDAAGNRQTAPAITEYLAPRALRWPWLRWLINMRIGRGGRGAFLP